MVEKLFTEYNNFFTLTKIRCEQGHTIKICRTDFCSSDSDTVRS